MPLRKPDKHPLLILKITIEIFASFLAGKGEGHFLQLAITKIFFATVMAGT